ncbi:MAG TPA: sulfatase-like hydrolase/transferase, partial [Clostridia bacterium]|nr:sulfatase-like hydrolase/transferase [Clostridia bacterium]
NWLDGREDPYYGGTSGRFTGCKFSLFEGGIRVPAMISWPGHIAPGQTIHTPAVSMDLFPTLLTAAGGDPSAYAPDGHDLSPMLMRGVPVEHARIFWEQGKQLAVRQGAYKLVLNGYIVEGEPAKEPVFLSNLEADPSERINLADGMPDLTRELQEAAEAWHARLEAHWAEHFAGQYGLA